MEIVRASKRRAFDLASAGLLGLCLPAAAPAGTPAWLAPDTVSGTIDLRLAGADGEPSWTDDGFGKARFGGGDGGGFSPRPVLAEAELVWRPPLGWDLTGTLAVAAQHEQDYPVDLIEAFVTWRPVPRGKTRLSARAGLMWPSVSLEHEGPAWAVTDMITPSAINSWIGEEVKPVAVEGTVSRALGSQRVSATLAVFGFNDTAGTLLSFRGWAMHDLKAGAFGLQKLPPLNNFMLFAQAAETRPTIEIDDRPGFYGKLAWSPAAPVQLEAFYYANRGVPEAVTPSLQWGWDTRFLHLGLRADLGPRTRLLAQALSGTTEMGIEEGAHYWVETRYRAAYLRATHEAGRVALSGRFDLFDSRERGSEMEREESEEGWALTGAGRLRLSDEAALLVEALHIDSRRGTRLRAGAAPRQSQSVVQLALRLTL
ncbi:MAG TPA: hypothetical protein VEA61_03770 [Allosphingosinicella sp.]|nr:hypothetical protein [Allosphingosinicella sp.]